MRSETASPFDQHRHDYSPWFFWSRASAEDQQRQVELQRRLMIDEPGYLIDERCFISELAAVQAERLELGHSSYIAAYAYVTGNLKSGRNCTINAFSVVRGEVTLGDAVRIGAHTSILAFNHTMADPDIEVFRQPITSRGITIGNDVWVGSHVVILDGVTVGDKAVIGAGAVVTRDVPAGAVAAGNPARVVRWRVAPPVTTGSADSPGDLGEKLIKFGARAREQAEEILARSWDRRFSGGLFVDRPNHAPTVRAQCDAIEIADLLLAGPPTQLPAEEQRDRLLALQDPKTGLVPAFDEEARPLPAPTDLFDGQANYHVLCVGYALDILGSRFNEPVHIVADTDAADLVEGLESQPWDGQAWSAGAWVDTVGTALRWNVAREVNGAEGAAEAVFGWLLTRANPRTGMWGSAAKNEDQLQIVNGFYRASRGTFAQFNLPLPYPERVIDTVLEHAKNRSFFAAERQNACNVLDVAHPLWLARKQTSYRSAEITALAVTLLNDALGHWTDGQGFGFQAPHPVTSSIAATVPGLQGTEMWLAIIWLLSDLVGISNLAGYRPRGVHRPDPAARLVAL
jgi:acetyltransferase-like isoleucine patch superfamily enzyme